MKHLIRAAVLLLFFILPGFYAPAAHAFTLRSAESVVIAQQEVITGSVFLTGQKITVDGTVNGDVYCAGQDIRITGTVSGDVLCAGQNVSVTGTTKGNVRSAGQYVTTGGVILKNESVFGQQITQNASVAGELIAAGQNVSMNGIVSGDVMTFSQSVTVNGSINGKMNITADSVTFGSGARAGNTVTYESPKEAAILPGASVSGSLQYIKSEQQSRSGRNTQTWPSNSGETRSSSGFVWPLIALLAALFMMKIAPSRMNAALTEMEANTLRSMGIGFLWLVFTPALILTLALTILGIPLAVMAGIAYFCAIVMARVFAGLAVGRVLVNGYWPAQKNSDLAAAVIGILVSWLMFRVPFIGWFASGAAVIWGIGGIVRFFRSGTAKPKR